MTATVAPLALALLLALAPAAHAAAGDHQHPDPAAHARPHDHADHAGDAFPVPEGHVPWTPDAPLLEGMARVREAVAGLERHRDGHPDERTVHALAAEVDAAIGFMFANCRLDPEPDVALHAVLAQLMVATQALHADPADLAPVAGMRGALDHYAELFDDPAAGAAH